MEEARQVVIGSTLADALRRNGSWCGETHLQKARFMLQEIGHVDTGFEFVLYKHEPFSFDLRTKINAMIGAGLLSLERHVGYGPTLVKTAAADRIIDAFPKTIAQVGAPIEFVASQIGDAGVADLERLATALFLINRNADKSDDQVAEDLRRLKPHVAEDAALDAVRTVRQMSKLADTA
jgi:hypothetical protein